jgi:hypothetical protein
MSQISGVKKPLCHTNSFTGEKVPKYGVETPYEEDLGKVSFTHVVIIIIIITPTTTHLEEF